MNDLAGTTTNAKETEDPFHHLSNAVCDAHMEIHVIECGLERLDNLDHYAGALSNINDRLQNASFEASRMMEKANLERERIDQPKQQETSSKPEEEASSSITDDAEIPAEKEEGCTLDGFDCERFDNALAAVSELLTVLPEYYEDTCSSHAYAMKKAAEAWMWLNHLKHVFATRPANAAPHVENEDDDGPIVFKNRAALAALIKEAVPDAVESVRKQEASKLPSPEEMDAIQRERLKLLSRGETFLSLETLDAAIKAAGGLLAALPEIDNESEGSQVAHARAVEVWMWLDIMAGRSERSPEADESEVSS